MDNLVTRPAASNVPQRKPRVDRKARQELYARTAAEVLIELGLQKASMQDIADRAGVAKILIYRQFPSKEALLKAIFEQVLGELRESHESPWPGYGAGLMQVLHRARTNRAAYLLLLRDSRSDPDAKHWFSIYEERQIEPLMEFMKPAEGAPAGARQRARLAARSLVSVVTETLISWIEDRDGLDDAERVRWFGQIVRAWRRASRLVYRLDAPDRSGAGSGRSNRVAKFSDSG